MNELSDQPSLGLPNCTSELAKELLHNEEWGDGLMGGELLRRSYDAYCIPLYNVHERNGDIWPAVAACLGMFHINRLLQKYLDHGDFERFAEVWKSAESLIESVLRELERKDGCHTCVEAYFWSCRHLGDVLSLKCRKCELGQSGQGKLATVKLANLTQSGRTKLEIANKVLELCEIRHRCCPECLEQG